MDRQQENALAAADFLAGHPHVARVLYPGLKGDPGHDLLRRQARGCGGMLSFEVDRPERVAAILAGVGVFSFAESLGGVETIVTHPATMSHASMPKPERERRGIGPGLVRMSVGIESGEDLLADIRQALKNAARTRKGEFHGADIWG
jgi:cystathionine beta-lyase/cystathionine gamma-synthase